MRIWVRAGPKLGATDFIGRKSLMAAYTSVTYPRVFKDRQWNSGRRKNRGALRLTVLQAPFLPANDIQGHGALNRKENSFPVHRRRTRAGSRYRVPVQACHDCSRKHKKWSNGIPVHAAAAAAAAAAA